jgi:hypothetical protein
LFIIPSAINSSISSALFNNATPLLKYPFIACKFFERTVESMTVKILLSYYLFEEFWSMKWRSIPNYYQMLISKVLVWLLRKRRYTRLICRLNPLDEMNLH